MTRLELAYLYHPTGVVLGKELKIIDCCPKHLGCGLDVADKDTIVEYLGEVTGCKGITCEKCWEKEYEGYGR